MRHFIDIISESLAPTLPETLANLSHEISGKSWEAAKRLMVSKTGSVQRGERFDDDLADVIFLRFQANSQRGHYDREDDIHELGRNARRLEGSKPMTVYRAAPKGAGIRPGDFCSSSRDEVGYYRHGGHVIHRASIPAHDLIAVDGRLGDGQELIYLPAGHEPIEPQVFYPTFREFYDASLSGNGQ